VMVRVIPFPSRTMESYDFAESVSRNAGCPSTPTIVSSTCVTWSSPGFTTTGI
jgi:hypothetical protein